MIGSCDLLNIHPKYSHFTKGSIWYKNLGWEISLEFFVEDYNFGFHNAIKYRPKLLDENSKK